ncbi:MAG: hypothetical protein FJX76_16600 [Armatimonadetes bacterium]|nr:hypothetical protein [Armatimonadota bacterium]
MARSLVSEVSAVIAAEQRGRMGYGDPDLTLEDARYQNEIGWRLEWPGWEGSVVVTEDVRLTDSGLRRAYATGMALAREMPD